MSGSTSIRAAATVCSVSGRWDHEQTSGLCSFRHSSYKSAGGATLSPVFNQASSLNSWINRRAGTARMKESASGGLENSRGCEGYHHHLGEAGSTRLSVDAAAKVEVTRGSKHTRALSGSKLSPAALHDRRMSSLSCFRAATFELASCYGRLSGEIQKQREIRGGRQGLGIVKALQDDSIFEREEQRWLREEQRWFREEQRWAREEVRLSAANQALQEEVKSLKKELEELRGQREYNGEITDISLKTLVSGMKNLLQALAIPGSEDSPLFDNPDALKQIAGSVHRSRGTSTTYIVEESESIDTPVTFVAAPDEVIAVVTSKTSSGSIPEPTSPTPAPPNASQSANGATSNSSKTSKSPTTSANKRTLKTGMEGDDVKELQDALSELGFYSGEEDIEFSVFSDGTESAVKTWQSTREFPEDGRMTYELMEALLAEAAPKVVAEKTESKKATKPNTQSSTKVQTDLKSKHSTPGNKHSASSFDLGHREIDRYERSNAQETGSGSSRRVYLLGENRWEEPDRVIKKREEERRKQNGSSTSKTVQMCFQCRAVGTMLCTECEGTGDLNVEEQFLEWLDEDQAKCPYCEGSGAIQCDVCFGQLINIQA